MKYKTALPTAFGLLVVGLFIVACGAAEPTALPECPICPTAAACPEAPACPTAEACAVPEACPTAEACPVCPECPTETGGATTGAAACPFGEEWATSGHADATAEAFTHWNEDDPKEIPAGCAGCHSEPGYLDFLGADGTTVGVVDNPAPVGTTVDCVVCHNEAAMDLHTVTFPSGISVTVEGPTARCMVCHQGRASTESVNEAIAGAGLTDLDTVSADLRFTNIHYFAAAATLYGGEVQGGYQYEGHAYDSKFDHVAGFDSCIGCHNQHSLELRLDQCSTCHTGVQTVQDLRDIRMAGSGVDYNGNGNVTEGIYYEMAGLQDLLLQGIQAYGKEVAGTDIAYSAASYPYFFVDANGNGTVDEGETDGYNAWTGRLLEAAYNYQTSIKDPGSYAHNGKYMIELLYDSIASLNEKISTPVDLTNAHRIDPGHFAGSEEAFRHWDEEGEVPGSCAKCHSADGLPFYLEQGVSIAQPTADGLNCATCHDDLVGFTRYVVNEVAFPSGASLTFGEGVDSNLCLECHQGRESTVSVNRLVSGLDNDTVSDVLRFLNVHYFAAGATLFGGEAQGAYQFEGKEYVGQNEHVAPYSQCDQCHNTHELTVNAEACSACHTNVTSEADLQNIRISTTDFDGDGDTTEGIAGEIETMKEALYAAMQAYSTATAGVGIEYNPDRYPYFFNDAGENYATWTPALLEAAYNLQYVTKDPGAYAHNAKYIMQILYDSTEAVGGDVSGETRP